MAVTVVGRILGGRLLLLCCSAVHAVAVAAAVAAVHVVADVAAVVDVAVVVAGAAVASLQGWAYGLRWNLNTILLRNQ
jgi:hypothetical protein